MMYTIFKADGFDYFSEMMPALHNYITVGVEGLLAEEARLQAALEMTKTVSCMFICYIYKYTHVS